MKKLGLLALLFAALLIILFVGRTDSQTPLTANDLGQIQMPPQTVLGNNLPVTGPLNAVPFSQFTSGISANIPTIIPPVVNGDCLKFAAPNSFADAGAPCNTGGGGGGGGTVFSVGQSVPAGMSVTGSPITTSGTLAINWNGTIPNAQIPTPTPTALGGIETITCAAGQFLNVINASGVPSCATPVGTVSTTGSPSSGQCAQFTGATTITGLAASCGLGTVTSVAATVPTGLSISGSPVTTSGTLAFNWSGTIPNAQVPTPTASALGGVESVTCAAGLFVNAIPTSGIPGCATPAGGGNVSTSGTITSGNCAQWNSTTTLISTSAPCGSGSGGSGTALGWINIKTNGATGDGTCHALSTVYGTLAAAQAVYPFASDLKQCLDWAATQLSINQAYLIGPTTNDSATVYCPTGSYVLENPIFFDQANNLQGSAAAWAVGTTYAAGTSNGFGGFNPQVTYNGIPWASKGSGNVGNAPTSSFNGFPNVLNLTLSFNEATFSTVTITNASPAVITLPSWTTSAVVANEPMVFTTMRYAVPGGSAPALPTGLNTSQVYYVVGSSISGNSFSVSTTPGGSAVNTSSAGVGVFFADSQVWQVSPNVSSTNFQNRVSFRGDDGAQSNSGCRFISNYMKRNAMFYIGPQDGNYIKGIGAIGSNGGVYRCNNDPLFDGFSVFANGGGAHNTIFDNVGAVGFSNGIIVGRGNGQLGDSNTLYNVNVLNNCIGVSMVSTQAFVNAIHDSLVNNNTTGVVNNNSEGIKIVGGNYSTNSGITNQYTISSVTTSSGFAFSGSYLQVNATIAGLDTSLQNPYCAFNAGYYVNNSNSLNGGYDNPYAYQCGYNWFGILTAHNGIIPLYLSSLNPNTGAATFQMPAYWGWIYAGYACCNQLSADLAAATTLYAAEVATPFFGQINVETVHMENDGVPTQLICACGGFGNDRGARISDVMMNAPANNGAGICCGVTAATGSGGFASFWQKFFSQQSIPFINASGTRLLLDDPLQSGGNSIGNLLTNNDRVLIAVGANQQIEGRHISTNNAIAADFVSANASNIIATGAISRNSRFTGGYNNGLGASSAIGAGLWDNPIWFTSSAAWHRDADNLLGDGQQDYADVADSWRANGWGIAPTYGVRPAPFSNACITSAHATTLGGALPAITHSSHLQGWVQVTNGGTGYSTNDTVTMGTGGTYTTPAQVQVIAQTGGVVSLVKVVTAGVYSVEPTSTLTATSGGTGTGLVITPQIPVTNSLGPNNGNWDVEYAISYPLLWGGAIYHVCDGFEVTPAHWGWIAGGGQKGYSYWQNLTTTNVPNLSWTQTGDSPFIYMNGEALQLMFPGLVLNLAASGTVLGGSGTCSTGTELFMVQEVHPTLGYVKGVRVDADSGTPWVPAWASATGVTCGNNVIGQQALTVINPY